MYYRIQSPSFPSKRILRMLVLTSCQASKNLCQNAFTFPELIKQLLAHKLSLTLKQETCLLTGSITDALCAHNFKIT